MNPHLHLAKPQAKAEAIPRGLATKFCCSRCWPGCGQQLNNPLATPLVEMSAAASSDSVEDELFCSAILWRKNALLWQLMADITSFEYQDLRPSSGQQPMPCCAAAFRHNADDAGLDYWWA